MSLKDRYRDASIHVQKNLGKSEGKAALEINRWKLYGYHKQVSEGNCTHPAPDTQSTSLKNKWNAWMACKGISQEKAMEAFISLVKDIDPAYEYKAGSAAQDSAADDASTKVAMTPLVSKSAERHAVYMKGYLRKQSAWMKHWNSRFFVLEKGQLNFFVKEGDTEARHTLLVEECEIAKRTDSVQIENKAFYGLTVSHSGLGYTWELMCETEENRDAWISALQAARGMSNANVMARRSNALLTKNEGSAVPGNGNGSGAAAAPAAAPAAAVGASADGAVLGGAPGSPTGSPTDNLPAALLLKIDNCIQNLMRSYSAKNGTEGWELMFVQEGLTASRKPGDTMMVRGTAVLPYSVKDLFSVISDIGKVTEINAQVDTACKLKSFNYCSSSNHWLFKKVFPTSARDMVNFTHWRILPDGKLIIASFNCEELHESGPDTCAVPSGAVRANLLMGGYVLEPNVTDGKTTVTYLVSSDLRGSIPNSISNTVARKQPLIVLEIAKQLAARPAASRSSPRELPTVADLTSITKNHKAPKFGYYESSGAKLAQASADAVSEAGGGGGKAKSSSSSSPGDKDGKNFRDWLDGVEDKSVFVPLLLPFLLAYVMHHWFLGLCLGCVISVPHVHNQLRLGEPVNAEDKYRNNLEFGNALPRGRIVVQFAVDLSKLLRYVESKREQYGLDISLTHVVAKAAANALAAFPALNGRMIGNVFYRAASTADIDVSVSADNSDMIAIKIPCAQKKTLNLIADELQAKSRSVRRAMTTGAGAGGGEKAAAGTSVSGGGPSSRSGIVLEALPYFLSYGIRFIMRLLASYYGIAFPSVGITPFPHGTCNIITTPRAENGPRSPTDFDSEVGVLMIPETDGMLSAPPVVITIGGISLKTVLDAERKLSPLRVLNLAVSIDSRAVGFAQGRQFAAILQGFMMEHKDD